MAWECDNTDPQFWGYITKKGVIIIKPYQESMRGKVVNATNHQSIADVICPFRAKDMPDAQKKVMEKYPQFKSELKKVA